MSSISLVSIKTLRQKTKSGVMDCRRALEESRGDLKKAESCLDCALAVRVRGGRGGGSMVLTENGHGWVRKYVAFRERMDAMVLRELAQMVN